MFKTKRAKSQAKLILKEFVFSRTFRTLDCSVQAAILELSNAKKLVSDRESFLTLGKEA